MKIEILGAPFKGLKNFYQKELPIWLHFDFDAALWAGGAPFTTRLIAVLF